MIAWFNFEHPQYLWGLMALPVFILLYVLMALWKKMAMRRIGDIELVKPLLQRRSVIKPVIRLAIYCLAYTAVIVALCNPRSGAKEKKVTASGIDVVVVFDVSNSMYSSDQQPDRLTVAKSCINKLISRMRGDRVAIVVFAGDALTHLPLTNDYSAAMGTVKALSPDDIAAQGTAIGAAIDQAMKSFDNDPDKKSKGGKAIIVVSDGEGHDTKAEESISNAVKAGATIFTIGVGTAEGGPVPEYEDGLPTGRYKTDESGGTVMSYLNEKMMREIASLGKGVYLHGDMNLDVTPIISRLGTMPRAETTYTDYEDFEDQYYWYALAAFVLLLLETTIGDRTYKFMEKKTDPFKHSHRSAS